MLKVRIKYDNGVDRFLPLYNAEIQVNLETKEVICIKYKGEEIKNFTHVQSISIED